MTHFSDIPPATDETVNEVDLNINSYESPFIESNRAYNTGNRVIMYSTSWCTYCSKAREYFAANNIDFEEFDIEKSTSTRQEYERIGGRGVPVILVGDQRLNGFNVSSFERIYQ